MIILTPEEHLESMLRNMLAIPEKDSPLPPGLLEHCLAVQNRMNKVTSGYLPAATVASIVEQGLHRAERQSKKQTE